MTLTRAQMLWCALTFAALWRRTGQIGYRDSAMDCYNQIEFYDEHARWPDD